MTDFFRQSSSDHASLSPRFNLPLCSKTVKSKIPPENKFSLRCALEPITYWRVVDSSAKLSRLCWVSCVSTQTGKQTTYWLNLALFYFFLTEQNRFILLPDAFENGLPFCDDAGVGCNQMCSGSHIFHILLWKWWKVAPKWTKHTINIIHINNM